MPVRTSITLNPITSTKKAAMEKYTSLKFKKPTHHIVDVLTAQEYIEGNKQFRDGIPEDTRTSKVKIKRAH